MAEEITITTVNGMLFVDKCVVRITHLDKVHWKAADGFGFQVDSFQCTDSSIKTDPFDKKTYLGAGSKGTDQAEAQKLDQTLVFTYNISPVSPEGVVLKRSALQMLSDPVVIIDPPGSGGPP